MGNRAVIAWHDNKANDIGIYLHWNGGLESVLAFLEAAKQLKVRDDDYGLARLTQIIGNFFGGDLSLGVGKLKELDTDNYDNGTYVVAGWAITRRLFTRSAEKMQKLTVDHLQADERQRYEDILKEVLEINRPIFARNA